MGKRKDISFRKTLKEKKCAENECYHFCRLRLGINFKELIVARLPYFSF